MHACISYTLSACGLYVHMHNILYTKYYTYCTFQTFVPHNGPKLTIFSHPWCLLFPGSKSITKRWLFKVVWPKGHDLLELRQVSPMWEDSHYRNLLSNFCGPKLWITPPPKEKNSQFQLKTAEIIIPFRIFAKIVGLINLPTCKIEYIRIDQGHYHLDRLIGISPSESSKWLSHQQPFPIDTEFKGSWSLLFGDRWMGNVSSKKNKNWCVTLKRFRKQ